jgi:hypothetical protein
MLAANVSAKVPVTMASRTRRRCFRVCCFFNTNSLRVIFRQSRSTRSPGFGPAARFPQMSGIALRLKGPCFCPGTVSAMWRSDQARVLGWPLGFAANGRYSLDECQIFRGLGVGINADSPIFCLGSRWCLPVRPLSPHAQVWRSCRSRQVACRRTRRTVRGSLRPFRGSMTCRHPGTAPC